MKAIIALLAVALLAGGTPARAQQTTNENPTPAEATPPAASSTQTSTDPASPPPTPPTPPTPSPTPPSPPASPAASNGEADEWREEVLAWEAPHKIEKDAVVGSLKEINRSVLVLGTVNGDVSTVSGDIAVLGEVNGNVSAISGTVTILGKVNGDVSVVSGDIRMAGVVTGKKSAMGGKIKTARHQNARDTSKPKGNNTNFNFRVDGGHFDFNFDRSGISGSINLIKDFWFSPFMLLWRSGLLILWVALACAVAALFQPSMLRAQTELRDAPARSVALGFLWTLLFWILLAGSLLLSLMLIGIPIVVLLVAFDLALKIFGMTLVFSVFGEWIAARLKRPGVSIYAAVFIGACALGLLRITPILGSLIWFVAGLFGIGATLTSRFGSPNRITPNSPSSHLAVTA